MSRKATFRVAAAAAVIVTGWLVFDAGTQWKLLGSEAQAPATKETRPAEKAALQPLNKNETVLIDATNKRMLLKAQVALREGALEHLCCLKQTKEHESILSLDARARTIHAGLLAIGAKTGTPVKFVPEYMPPTGQKIDIFLSWTDADGKPQRVPAQSWVRHATRRFWSVKLDRLPAGVKLPKDSELRFIDDEKELLWYGPMTPREREQFLALSDNKDFRSAIEYFFAQGKSREMKADWVFAGSRFLKDEETNKEYYLAEDGDLICVANFSSATIDIAIHSSAQGDDLAFEAYTERIPPRGTAVTIELIPVFEKEKTKDATSPAK
jgi:hypothetical protein